MRILSGIQCSGSKHLGNYIGAIRQYVTYQELGDASYMVADLHAFTLPRDPDEIRESTRATAAILIASGLDPRRCTLFVQSHVGGEHAEGAWLLSCIATFGELRRMHQFKDKSDGKGENISAGLLTYPVLQAADIVLHSAEAVPVGEDQKQHIELARNLAQRFNNRFGADLLTIPEPMIPKVGGRIMDLQDPTRKMSTSDASVKGTVYITDTTDAIAKKFRSAVTDSSGVIGYDPAERPGISNLVEIFHIATGKEIAEIEDEFAGQGYGAFKTAVAEAVDGMLGPVRQRYSELMDDPAELDRLLGEGAAKAHEVSGATLTRMKRAMGCLMPTLNQ